MCSAGGGDGDGVTGDSRFVVSIHSQAFPGVCDDAKCGGLHAVWICLCVDVIIHFHGDAVPRIMTFTGMVCVWMCSCIVHGDGVPHFMTLEGMDAPSGSNSGSA